MAHGTLRKKRGIKGRKERRGRGQNSKKEKGKEKEGERCVMERARGSRGKRRGENRRKRRREKVMEEAVVTGMLQPTGRKVVR